MHLSRNAPEGQRDFTNVMDAWPIFADRAGPFETLASARLQGEGVVMQSGTVRRGQCAISGPNAQTVAAKNPKCPRLLPPETKNLVIPAKAHCCPGKLRLGCRHNLIRIPVERRGLRLKRGQVTDSGAFSKARDPDPLSAVIRQLRPGPRRASGMRVIFWRPCFCVSTTGSRRNFME